MDSYKAKNRVTRQTESKGRQTNNSSLDFQQIPNYKETSDKVLKKNKNNFIEKTNSNSPESNKVSEKIDVKTKFDETVTQPRTTKKSNITILNSELVALTTMPTEKNNDSDTLSSRGTTTVATNKYLSTNSKEDGKFMTPEQDKKLFGKKVESDDDDDFDNDTLSDVEQNKKPSKINIFVSDEKKNNNGMKDGHFNFLHTYVRDDLFKKIKILADSHLEINGFIMKKCLEKSEYDSSKHGPKFINDCRSEIRKTMNSRRGYVKRKITALMIEMLKRDKESLYWVDLMKHFYDESKEDDDDIMNAWYNYVFYFLPYVNKEWRSAVLPDNLIQQKRMFPALYVSDEALVQWIIEIQFPKVQEYYKIGFDNVGKNVGKGKHDTNVNLERYTILHEEIKSRRKHYETALRWNELFWIEVKKRHSEKFKKRKESDPPSKISLKKTLPLPGMNEEEDMYEMYKKNRNNNNNLKPDEIGSSFNL